MKTEPYRNLDAFKKQWEESLRLLRRDAVDILYLHEADWAAYWANDRQHRHLQRQVSYDFDAAPAANFLCWAREQSTARFIGISGNNAHLLARVMQESTLRY